MTDISKLINGEKLTSEVYGPDNLPKDWADLALLVPHETMRREMQRLITSVNKLSDRVADKSIQDWHALWFCEYFIDVFESFVELHHEGEEKVYFPWIATKADIPEKKISKDHEELVALLLEMGSICSAVVKKGGQNCDDEIEDLKTKLHKFVPEMNSHLMEEERDIPPEARKYFTKNDEDEIMKEMIKHSKYSELRDVFPIVLEAMNEWAKPEYVEDFLKVIPAPLIYMTNKYFIPDYETYLKPKRDAPLLNSKPRLSRKGCCGISFCFPCVC